MAFEEPSGAFAAGTRRCRAVVGYRMPPRREPRKHGAVGTSHERRLRGSDRGTCVGETRRIHHRQP